MWKERSSRKSLSTLPFLIPSTFIEKDKHLGIKRIYHNLGIFQRVFLTLENSDASRLGKIVNAFMLCVIALSCISYVMSTDSHFKYQPTQCDAPVCQDDLTLCPQKEICAPVPLEWMTRLDFVCIIIFMIDYGVRMATVSSVPARLAGLVPQIVLRPLEDLMSTKDHPLRRGADHSSFYVAINDTVSGSFKNKKTAISKVASTLKKGVKKAVDTGRKKKKRRLRRTKKTSRKSFTDNPSAGGDDITDIEIGDRAVVCASTSQTGETVGDRYLDTSTDVEDAVNRSFGADNHDDHYEHYHYNTTDAQKAAAGDEDDDRDDDYYDESDEDDDGDDDEYKGVDDSEDEEESMLDGDSEDGSEEDRPIWHVAPSQTKVTADNNNTNAGPVLGTVTEAFNRSSSLGRMISFMLPATASTDAPKKSILKSSSDEVGVIGVKSVDIHDKASDNLPSIGIVAQAPSSSLSRQSSLLIVENTANEANDNSPDGDRTAGAVVNTSADTHMLSHQRVNEDQQRVNDNSSPRSVSFMNVESKSSSKSFDETYHSGSDEEQREDGYERAAFDSDYYNEEDLILPWYQQIFMYAMKPLNIIDLLIIVPGIADYAIGTTHAVTAIRVLRFCRMFRILQVARRNKAVPMLQRTLENAFRALALVAVFVTLGIILFGCLEYYLEMGEFKVTEDYPNGAYLTLDIDEKTWIVSSFVSIPVSMYWAVITSTTIGYGDLYPTTVLGRLVACACMYFGVLLLALPITVIGANFSREYDRVHGDKDERMVFKTLTELATLFHEESLVRAEGKRPDSSSSEHVFARVLTVASVLDNTKRVFMKERLKEKMERIKQQGRRKKEAARVAATEATARATKQPDKVNSKIIKSALSNSSSMHSKGDEDRSESPPLYRECFASASMKSGEFEDVIEESIDDMIRTLQDAKMKHRQMRLRRRGSSQIEAPVDS